MGRSDLRTVDNSRGSAGNYLWSAGMQPDAVPDFPGYRLDELLVGAAPFTDPDHGDQSRPGPNPSPVRAQVWRAARLADDRTVVIKVFPAAAADLARREAALQSAVDHPHLLTLLDVVGAEGRVGLVTGFAAGGSLSALLTRRGRLTWPEALTVLIPMADVLAVADERELVHGDVSAGNILFDTGGRPVLADLGAARAAAELSLPVAVTPTDVAPEVARGAAPDHRSDLFSLGSVALQCLSGRPAWPADTVTDALIQSTLGQWPDPECVIAPESLLEIVRRLLDPEPGRRGSAAALAVDLRRVGEPAPVDLSEQTADGQPRLPATQVRPEAAALRAAVEKTKRRRLRVRLGVRVGPRRAGGRRAKAAGRHAAGQSRPGTQGSGGRPGGRRAGAAPAAARGSIATIRNAALAVVVVLALGAGAVRVGLWWARSGRVDPPTVASVAQDSVPDTPGPADTPAGATAATAGAAVTVATGQANWVAVVAGLDANRARALTQLDPNLLDLVYVPQAPARAVDLATIQQLRAAGYRLAGAGHTITSVALVSSGSAPPAESGTAGDGAVTANTTLVRVVESMPQVMITGSDGQVIGHTQGSPSSTVLLTLVRADDGFRIRSVRPG